MSSLPSKRSTDELIGLTRQEMIRRIIEIQDTIADLTRKTEKVNAESDRLLEEKALLDDYINNLLTASRKSGQI